VNLDKFEEGGAKLEEMAAPDVRANAPYKYRGSVPLVDQWLYTRLASTVELVNDALTNYRFHEAAQGVYQFFWGDFCDWYIEWIKPELQSADREQSTIAWKNLFAAFDDALRLLHPFMPFLTEELWHQLPQNAGSKSIALETFPTARKEWAQGKIVDAVDIFTQIQDVISALRNIRAEMRLDAKKKVPAEFWSTAELIRNRVQAESDVITRLAVLSELEISPAALEQAGGAVRSTAQFDVRIAYSDVVDVKAEKTRIKRELEGLQKAIGSKEGQLGNETFRSRAPEKVIRGLEATLAEQRLEFQKLQHRLTQLEKGA
jgi:valyl-tRNA synthetase